MGDYAQAIRNALGKTQSYMPTMPSISFTDPYTGTLGEGGFISTVTPYIIWGLLITFVILLVLVIVHYTIRPIFNFGNNPNALIDIPAADWDYSWQNTDQTVKFTDTVASKTLPKSNYTIVFDTIIDNPAPSTSTSTMYVLVYKTTGTTKLTDFAYLTDGTGVPADPSLVVVYDALQSAITAYLVVGTNSWVTCTAQAVPATAYRVAIVVSDSVIELYLNGKWTQSTTFAGKTPAGGITDSVFSTPAIYSQNVAVRNLATTGRVVSSGEIRMAGTPAIGSSSFSGSSNASSSPSCPT